MAGERPGRSNDPPQIRRVFVIASWYPTDQHPALGSFIEEQAIALQRDYAVTVIAPVLAQWRDRLLGGDGGVRVEQRRGVDVVRARALPSVPRSRRAGYSAFLRATQRAYDAATATFGGADLLHAHVVRHAGWAATRIGPAVGLPVVLTEHSGPFDMHLRHPTDRACVASTLRRVNGTVAVSRSLLNQMHPYLTKPATVLGNIIDTEFFSPAPHAPTRSRVEPFRVLSVGLLTTNKGMDEVLEAFALFINQSERPVEVTIVGDGPVRAALEARARELGIRDRCSFAGLVDREGVRDAMRRCDAFVLASHGETFGVVVAEAMACEKPVIVTRSGGPDEIVEPGTGILVSVGDVAAIATSLLSLSRETVTVNTRAARQRVIERYGTDAFLRGIRGVYRRAFADLGSVPVTGR